MTVLGNRKTVIIDDVAKAAGVSVPTVSRVLTGAAKVSPEKRARVAKAIEELGYRPSTSARTLAGGPPDMVAIVAGDTSQYGYANTIRGVEEAARSAGYVVLVVVLESAEQEDVSSALRLLLNQPLAGAVVLQFDEPGVVALASMPEWIPVVAVSGAPNLKVPQADLDEVVAAEEMTLYLLGLGHALVHHVKIPSSISEDGRTIGWRNAMHKRGLEAPEPLQASWDAVSGRSIGLELSAQDDVTAVFCGNDEIAMGLIRGLELGGKRVPADVSVVGFDDHPLAELWLPALTTVRQDFVSLGRRAFELLMNRIQDSNSSQHSTARPRLIIRESAAPPPHHVQRNPNVS